MKPRKILAIDARPLARGTGGIQRYLNSVLPYLVFDTDLEIVFYSDHPLDQKLSGTFSNIKIRHVPIDIGRPLAWHIWVCYWAYLDQPDIFWSPRHHLPFIVPAKTRSVVTIHDFVWKTVPETMPKAQLVSEKILMPLAIRKADRIICISKTTQSQLANFFPGYEVKSSVILHGEYDSPSTRKICAADQPGYFLAVGTLEPRKNYERMIEAFDHYVKDGGTKNLIIIGKDGWGCRPIFKCLKESENSSRVTILQNVSDAQLSDLYCRASGFVSPSLDEGYGLPPQEARQYKLPLLLSDIEVYRELYSTAELWVDPLSASSITRGLHQLEKLPRIETSGPSKEKHTWSDCAKLLTKEF